MFGCRNYTKITHYEKFFLDAVKSEIPFKLEPDCLGRKVEDGIRVEPKDLAAILKMIKVPYELNLIDHIEQIDEGDWFIIKPKHPFRKIKIYNQ